MRFQIGLGSGCFGRLGFPFLELGAVILRSKLGILPLFHHDCFLASNESLTDWSTQDGHRLCFEAVWKQKSSAAVLNPHGRSCNTLPRP